MQWTAAQRTVRERKGTEGKGILIKNSEEDGIGGEPKGQEAKSNGEHGNGLERSLSVFITVSAKHGNGENWTGMDSTRKQRTAKHRTEEERNGKVYLFRFFPPQGKGWDKDRKATEWRGGGMESIGRESRAGGQQRNELESSGWEMTGEERRGKERTGSSPFFLNGKDGIGQDRSAKVTGAQWNGMEEDGTGSDCSGRDAKVRHWRGTDLFYIYFLSSAKEGMGAHRKG